MYLEGRLAHIMTHFIYFHDLFGTLCVSCRTDPDVHKRHSERDLEALWGVGQAILFRLILRDAYGICSTFTQSKCIFFLVILLLLPSFWIHAYSFTNVTGMIFSDSFKYFTYLNCQGKYILTVNNLQKVFVTLCIIKRN